jgi:hypothetical protein
LFGGVLLVLLVLLVFWFFGFVRALDERRFGPDTVSWDNGSRPWDKIRLISGWRWIGLR